jgi:bifunctional DNA-binding transcriptional regulator/antitoxin component of YhaV-PrlF toxin-antitoxin module
MVATTRIDQGTVRIPKTLREQFGLTDGAILIAEAGDGGIILRPIDDEDVEIYTPERIAEFTLLNALDEEDYGRAVEEVKRMGLDPDTIDHFRPRRRQHPLSG